MAVQKVFDGEQWTVAPKAEVVPLHKWRAFVKIETIDGHRVYVSRMGLKFCVAPAARPGVGEVVFFTSREYDWVREQKITPEEFSLLWKFKKEDWTYCPIPESAVDEPKRMAERFATEIIRSLEAVKRG